MKTEDFLKNYYATLEEAKGKLAEIKLFCGDEPTDKIISGWVLEKSIQYYLRSELEKRGIKGVTYQENISIKLPNGERGYRRPDIIVKKEKKKIYIEVKNNGMFKVEQIEKFKPFIENLGSEEKYLYITILENSPKYYKLTIDVFGEDHSFVLKGKHRKPFNSFIDKIVEILDVR